MKGKKRIIVTLLFLINIIMLVAAVIPHRNDLHEAGLACRTTMSHASSSPGKRFMLQQRMYDSFLLSHSIRTYG